MKVRLDDYVGRRFLSDNLQLCSAMAMRVEVARGRPRARRIIARALDIYSSWLGS